MTWTNANTSAFPCQELNGQGSPITSMEFGLTKRELFAAMAMQGICANSIPGSHHQPQNTARDAIAQADALLAELAK